MTPLIHKNFYERSIEKLSAVLHLIKQKNRGFISPITNFFGKFRFLSNSYKNIWVRMVYDDGNFSKKGLLKIISLTVLSVYVLWILFILSIQSLSFVMTSKIDEVVYMTNSQEVDPEGDIYSAQGCTILPCDEESSIYFRIEPSLFSHAYELVTKGQIFYPDYLAAAIPPGLNKCTITSYGLRWKFFMRGMDIYPYILRASCNPVK